ncbi:MAG: PAS domain S-box protein [Burkholderiaceae bacterium]|nr:PAS domain S-box protein [Burkholderiaceae bacterium]
MNSARPAPPASVCSETELLAEVARLRLLVEELQSQKVATQHLAEMNHTLMQRIGEGIAVAQHGKVVFANAKALEIMGLTEDQAMGSDLFQWRLPQDRPEAIRTHFQRMLGLGDDHQDEVLVNTSSGEQRWLDLRTSTVSWQGMPASLMVFADITRRRLEAASLKRSEERYRHVVNNLNEGMIVIQGNRVVFNNPQAASILRVPPETVLGTFFGTWVHPDDLPAMRERVKRRSQGEMEEASTSFRTIGSDLSTRWIRSHNITVNWEGQPATMAFFSDVTEHRAVTEALQRSEAQYKAVVENVGEGMVGLIGDKVVFANERALSIVGRSRDEAMNTPFLRFVHPDDRGWALERFQKRLSGEDGVPGRSETRLLLTDGSEIWVEISITLVSWDGAQASLMFMTDITARKLLEQQLQDTLDERETVLESSVMGIAFLSNTGRFRWANQAMLSIFRVQETPALASMEPLYTSREQYLRVGTDVDACIREGKDFRTEQLMRRMDGSTFWAMLSGKAVNPGKNQQGTVWVVMDISERKALEKALQQTTVEREAILNNTLVGISYNRNRCVEWVNDKYLEMTGLSRDEVIGKSSRMFYASDEEYEEDGRAINAGLLSEGGYSSERQIARKNADPFWVVLSGRCVLEKDPSAGVIWTMLDISKRRQAEEDTRAALTRQTELNALRSRFVSMTSHEFRTPLATILSSAELMRYYSDRMDAAEKDETLAGIEIAVQRMTNMLERVMLIGKSDADMLDFAPRTLNLDHLCRDLMSEAMAQQRGATSQVNYRFDLADPMGGYDEKLLRHIFSNLLSNALKYSPEGLPIEFRIQKDGQKVVFEVVDQGIGIPQTEIPHLFDTFHRASNVGNIPGTGLGLSIVKKSVEVHGGTIDVESIAGDDPRHGTRFRVRL